MIYKNVKTGAMIKTDVKISGENWQPVTPTHIIEKPKNKKKEKADEK
ncbi:MAG: hypothetical protein KBT03_07585 [Bacteroidales bacterium]|nr:hypothetical protein [Candidatus Scybalousia scybalohippi]